MKEICIKSYFIGFYNGSKEVSRETFLEYLGHITKREYEILIRGMALYRGNVYFRIINERKMIEDEFDLMYKEIWNTFKDPFYTSRAYKVIEGIKHGEINKENLNAKIADFTKKVKSERSLDAWNNLADWFSSIEWTVI
jgi:hypothetical protein